MGNGFAQCRHDNAFRQHKHLVGKSWRNDETYTRINDDLKYLYRTADKEGKTVGLLLTATRDKAVPMRFIDQAMRANIVPEKVTMRKIDANKATIDQIIDDKEISVEVRQVRYLINIVERDYRAIKRITKPMLAFQTFTVAGNVLVGIELLHMLCKGQFNSGRSEAMLFAEQFYAMAGQIRPA